MILFALDNFVGEPFITPADDRYKSQHEFHKI